MKKRISIFIEDVKTAIELLSFNLTTLLQFEILYKVMSVIVFGPFFWWLFSLTMKVTGFTYITPDNLVSFVSNPLFIIMVLINITIIAFYTVSDIYAVIFIMDESYLKKKAGLFQTIEFAFKGALEIFIPQNVLMVPFVLLLIPFVSDGASSSFISRIDIPEFIMDVISATSWMNIGRMMIMALLAVLLATWIYSLHYLTLEDSSFIKAAKRSAALSKGNRIWDAIRLFVIESLFNFVLATLMTLVLFVIMLVLMMSAENMVMKVFVVTIGLILLALLAGFGVIFSTPITYAFISAKYYRYKTEHEEEIIHAETKREYTSNRKIKLGGRIALSILFVVSVVGGSVFLYRVSSGKLTLNVESLRVTSITAHRGASSLYPENTMPAFEGANRLHADWIELDVTCLKTAKYLSCMMTVSLEPAV